MGGMDIHVCSGGARIQKRSFLAHHIRVNNEKNEGVKKAPQAHGGGPLWSFRKYDPLVIRFHPLVKYEINVQRWPFRGGLCYLNFGLYHKNESEIINNRYRHYCFSCTQKAKTTKATQTHAQNHAAKSNAAKRNRNSTPQNQNLSVVTTNQQRP